MLLRNKILLMVQHKNLLVYDPVTWAGWNITAGVTKDASGIELTSINNVVTYIEMGLNLAAETDYGILYTIVSASIAGTFTLSSISAFDSVNLENTTGVKKTVAKSKSTITNNSIRYFLRSKTEETDTVKLKGLGLFELPTGSQIASDFNTLTPEQLNTKYLF